jgi:D-arabinono-1,4-lactone oxidase
MDPAIASELEKFPDNDSVPFRAVSNHTQSTWARTFHSHPELYIQPQSLPEVEKAVNLARRCRRRITTVGCGHSPSTITSTSSWLLNLDNFNKILDVDRETGAVRMQSGIRLYKLSEELDKVGLAMPNLGSINDQSIAGAISTGTHGSTLRHGTLSSSISHLKVTLSNGKTQACSRDENEELFRAALLSLGALGVVTEVTFHAVPAFTLAWKQVIDTDHSLYESWDKELWKQTEFVRVWWFPYTRRGVVWTAEKTEEPKRDPKSSLVKKYYEKWFAYHVYHNLLGLSQYMPPIIPWIEWFVFGMQYRFTNGLVCSAVQPSGKALLMDCLYSQFVNEWAIPLDKGPEALRRLSSWLNNLSPSDADYLPHGIPFSADGLYVHAPVEVRVTDTSTIKTPRPFLDQTETDGPTLYLNATLYRPYNSDPPCRHRYYQGFEYLMKELGGRPHWAKNFETPGHEIEEMYGDSLRKWREIRDDVDPEGMFVGDWHRRTVLGSGPRYPLEEVEIMREDAPGGGIIVRGVVGKGEGTLSTKSSEESFDELRASEITMRGD